MLLRKTFALEQVSRKKMSYFTLIVLLTFKSSDVNKLFPDFSFLRFFVILYICHFLRFFVMLNDFIE